MTASWWPLAKHGLTERDIAPNVNLFNGVRVERDGALSLLDGPLPPGARWCCGPRCRVIVAPRQRPPPLDRGRSTRPRPLRLTAWPATAARPTTRSRTATAEAQRAFENTASDARPDVTRRIAVHDEVVGRAAPWSGRVARRRRRCASSTSRATRPSTASLYDADDPAERYSAPDTIAAQRNIFLGHRHAC